MQRTIPYLFAVFATIAAGVPNPALAQSEAAAQTVVAGTFGDLEGHDSSGDVRMRSAQGRTTLTFGENFDSEDAPEVYVYLSKTPDYSDGERLRVARLKGSDGAQRYTFKTPADLGAYRYVILWCRPFSVGIGLAELNAVN